MDKVLKYEKYKFDALDKSDKDYQDKFDNLLNYYY